MTRDDIIRMAREAGAMFDHMSWVERDLAPVFQRFATLVAAAEREECAQVCEEWLHGKWHNQGVIAAMMIRARGET